jgi:hypothetical protein
MAKTKVCFVVRMQNANLGRRCHPHLALFKPGLKHRSNSIE